jgi:Icc-related predicted phosphoesterase
MNILFTSDLHGEEAAFSQFGNLLARKEYDIGIIAGDIQEEYITKKEVISLLGLSEDDLLEELASPDPPDEIHLWDSSNAKHVKAALEKKAEPLKEMMLKSGKPVLIVRGNHDKTDWKSEGNMINIGQVHYDNFGYRFVGYEYTELDKSNEEQMVDMELIETLMNSKTILVTHAPPYGILDLMQIHDTQKGTISTHIGSKALQVLKQRKPPRLHLFGHVHSSFGVQGRNVNGSYSSVLRKMIKLERNAKGFLIKSVR